MIIKAQSCNTNFHFAMIKPSHYDDDGYVIQWIRSAIPSNSLAVINGIALDCVARRVLGENVDIKLSAYDETNTRIKTASISKRIEKSGGFGLVALVGVQTNQFPRALDLARQFRAAGIQVAIGGFHVSACLSMLPELPADLQEALDLGITLFAGELEGRLDTLLQAAYRRELKPLYNYMNDLPRLTGAVTPFLPKKLLKWTANSRTTFDAGRGCPFLCSFCTIINVQGRQSRFRSADDVEQIVHANLAQGVSNFFITDDNFARNLNWEAILDRLIKLRQQNGLLMNLIVQVDTMCHKIPGFIEKAGLAGVNRVFIGLENINPESLKEARKGQNRITEYRTMLQAWHHIGTVTYAGFILGFSHDTPESIERDIKIIQRELPIDILEFFILTPLPGSQDHKQLYEQGVVMDADMNKYDLEHVITEHPLMSKQQLSATYRRAWDIYYTPEHVETILRRAKAWGYDLRSLMHKLLLFYTFPKVGNIHPLEGGLFRRKYRRDRRSGLPIEKRMAFYSHYINSSIREHLQYLGLYLSFTRILRRVKKDDRAYTDIALRPVEECDFDELELYSVSAAARASVNKIRNSRKRDQ